MFEPAFVIGASVFVADAQLQGIAGEELPADRRGRPIVRDDLHLVCYEYTWAQSV